MERSPLAPTCVGIDVAKDRLDVHLRPAGETFALSRDGIGLDALVGRLAALAPALVVLEATGGFEVTVAGTPAAAGLPLVAGGSAERAPRRLGLGSVHEWMCPMQF